MSLTAVLVIGAGIGATVVDIRQRRVPNVLTMGLASVGLVLAMAGVSGVTVGGALGGLALGLALLLPAHVFGATGAGDVKLLAAFGALLGPGGVFDAFLRAAILGGVMALVVALWRGRLRETLYGTAMLVTTRNRAVTAIIEHPAANNRFPYAPAIACGAVLVVLGW
ncbi:MAG: A24 family peptidase [Vicinamibacterales bacterium]